MQAPINCKAVEVTHEDSVYKISHVRELESYFAAIRRMCQLAVSEIDPKTSVLEAQEALITQLEVQGCLTDECKREVQATIERGHPAHLPDFQIRVEATAFNLHYSKPDVHHLREEKPQGGSFSVRYVIGSL